MGRGKVSIASRGRARSTDLRRRRRARSLDRRPPRNIPSSALNERESQQARAQQHETGCGQCEEAVGHQVMSTHVAPATLEAGPNSLKLSESACLNAVVIAQGQALERKPSNAWAMKIPALNRPKNAVTVSIIARSFAPRHEHNATGPRTVKRIPGRDRRSGRSDALAQQFRRGGEPGSPCGHCNTRRPRVPGLGIFTKICLAPAKIKRRINRNKALRVSGFGACRDIPNRR
jgi:hypothetical protein